MSARLFNVFLRLSSLTLKLLLTLYMGKYLGLSDLGTYGLAAAYVAISIPILGQRLDYVVLREIVDLPELELASKMRDQAILYLSNYIGLIFIVVGCFILIPTSIDKSLAALITCLAILESFASITSANLVSIKRPILANLLFFIRSSLWVIPVICLGLYKNEFRTDNVIFIFWLGGVLLSLIITFIIFRKLPWQKTKEIPVNWHWIITSIKSIWPIWLSGICAALATNLDRPIVENLLNRDLVGVLSFYASFVVAIYALLSNGIFQFGYPLLVDLYKKQKIQEFFALFRTMSLQASLSTAGMAIVIGIAIPYLGIHLDRLEFAEHAHVLWLMLFAAWIKGSSEGLYYVQYARHQDRDIWIGNFILLIFSLSLNVGLITWLGFIGVGYSAVLTTAIFSFWRVYSVLKYHEPPPY